MYKTLYRKYRPNKFSEVIGQDDTINILKKSIENNKISHAYLFYGSHGTGKTSTAKIFSKEVNNLDIDINELDEYQDILELDAASNNGVEDIRKLCDSINFSPAKLNYKIYIIDEAHMLSISAFNALLKTLEETPSHIIFILATTEIHKIPSTISSRCQKFNFTKINNNQIKELLSSVAKKEKIKITEDAVYKISTMSNGSLRDALGILEQVSLFSDEEINSSHITTLYGKTSKEKFKNLLKFIFEKKHLQIINFVNDIDYEYKNIEIFIKEFMNFLLDSILENDLSKERRENIFIIINKLNSISLKIKDCISLNILLKSILLEITFSISNNTSLNDKNLYNKQKKTKESTNKKIEVDKNKKVDNLNNLNTEENENNNLQIDIINLLMLKTFFKKEKNISLQLKKKILKDTPIDDKISMFLKDMDIPLACENLIIFTCANEANIDILNKQENKKKFTDKILTLIDKNEVEIVFIQREKWDFLRKEFIKKYKKELINFDDIKILEDKILQYKNNKSYIDHIDNDINNIDTLEKVSKYFDVKIEEE